MSRCRRLEDQELAQLATLFQPFAQSFKVLSFPDSQLAAYVHQLQSESDGASGKARRQDGGFLWSSGTDTHAQGCKRVPVNPWAASTDSTPQQQPAQWSHGAERSGAWQTPNASADAMSIGRQTDGPIPEQHTGLSVQQRVAFPPPSPLTAIHSPWPATGTVNGDAVPPGCPCHVSTLLAQGGQDLTTPAHTLTRTPNLPPASELCGTVPASFPAAAFMVPQTAMEGPMAGLGLASPAADSLAVVPATATRANEPSSTAAHLGQLDTGCARPGHSRMPLLFADGATPGGTRTWYYPAEQATGGKGGAEKHPAFGLHNLGGSQAGGSPSLGMSVVPETCLDEADARLMSLMHGGGLGVVGASVSDGSEVPATNPEDLVGQAPPRLFGGLPPPLLQLQEQQQQQQGQREEEGRGKRLEQGQGEQFERRVKHADGQQLHQAPPPSPLPRSLSLPPKQQQREGGDQHTCGSSYGPNERLPAGWAVSGPQAATPQPAPGLAGELRALSPPVAFQGTPDVTAEAICVPEDFDPALLGGGSVAAESRGGGTGGAGGGGAADGLQRPSPLLLPLPAAANIYDEELLAGLPARPKVPRGTRLLRPGQRAAPVAPRPPSPGPPPGPSSQHAPHGQPGAQRQGHTATTVALEKHGALLGASTAGQAPAPIPLGPVAGGQPGGPQQGTWPVHQQQVQLAPPLHPPLQPQLPQRQASPLAQQQQQPSWPQGPQVRPDAPGPLSFQHSHHQHQQPLPLGPLFPQQQTVPWQGPGPHYPHHPNPQGPHTGWPLHAASFGPQLQVQPQHLPPQLPAPVGPQANSPRVSTCSLNLQPQPPSLQPPAPAGSHHSDHGTGAATWQGQQPQHPQQQAQPGQPWGQHVFQQPNQAVQHQHQHHHHHQQQQPGPPPYQQCHPQSPQPNRSGTTAHSPATSPQRHTSPAPFLQPMPPAPPPQPLQQPQPLHRVMPTPGSFDPPSAVAPPPAIPPTVPLDAFGDVLGERDKPVALSPTHRYAGLPYGSPLRPAGVANGTNGVTAGRSTVTGTHRADPPSEPGQGQGQIPVLEAIGREQAAVASAVDGGAGLLAGDGGVFEVQGHIQQDHGAQVLNQQEEQQQQRQQEEQSVAGTMDKPAAASAHVATGSMEPGSHGGIGSACDVSFGFGAAGEADGERAVIQASASCGTGDAGHQGAGSAAGAEPGLPLGDGAGSGAAARDAGAPGGFSFGAGRQEGAMEAAEDGGAAGGGFSFGMGLPSPEEPAEDGGFGAGGGFSFGFGAGGIGGGGGGGGFTLGTGKKVELSDAVLKKGASLLAKYWKDDGKAGSDSEEEDQDGPKEAGGGGGSGGSRPAVGAARGGFGSAGRGAQGRGAGGFTAPRRIAPAGAGTGGGVGAGQTPMGRGGVVVQTPQPTSRPMPQLHSRQAPAGPQPALSRAWAPTPASAGAQWQQQQQCASSAGHPPAGPQHSTPLALPPQHWNQPAGVSPHPSASFSTPYNPPSHPPQPRTHLTPPPVPQFSSFRPPGTHSAVTPAPGMGSTVTPVQQQGPSSAGPSVVRPASGAGGFRTPTASVVALPPAHNALPRLTTAGGKPVVVGPAALQRARALLGEEGGGGDGRTAAAGGAGVGVDPSHLVSGAQLQPGASAGAVAPKASAAAGSMPGLMTAGGRSIVVSDEKRRAAAALLGEAAAAEAGGVGPGGPTAQPSAPGNHGTPPSMPGLMTAGGRPVEVSEESRKAATALLGTGTAAAAAAPSDAATQAADAMASLPVTPLAGVQSAQVAGPPSSPMPGLMTAAGKAVTVSEEQRRAAAARLGVAAPEQGAGIAAVEVTGGSGTGVAVSLPALPTVGLMTAGGKVIVVSDEKRRAAAALLGDAAAVSPSEQRQPGASPARVSPASTPAAALPGPASPHGMVMGLMTAGGKRIVISDEKKRAAAALLGEGPPAQGAASPPPEKAAPKGNDETPSNSPMPGLVTAGGKSIVVSDEKRRAAAALLGEASVAGAEAAAGTTAGPGPTAAPEASPPPRPPGLMTAGGKSVVVSEERLRAAAVLLGEAGAGVGPGADAPGASGGGTAGAGAPLGLMTAGGKVVAVSDEKRRAAAVLLNAADTAARPGGCAGGEKQLASASGSDPILGPLYPDPAALPHLPHRQPSAALPSPGAAQPPPPPSPAAATGLGAPDRPPAAAAAPPTSTAGPPTATAAAAHSTPLRKPLITLPGSGQSAGAITPGPSVHGAPSPFTGGLKRPRPGPDPGSATRLPPRPQSAPTGRRQFKSPLPANYSPSKAPASAGRLLQRAAGRRGAAAPPETPAPKRPRVSSAFDDLRGSGPCLGLAEYFALPPPPPLLHPAAAGPATGPTVPAASAATGPSGAGPTPPSGPVAHDTDTPMGDRTDGGTAAPDPLGPGAQPPQPPADGVGPAAGQQPVAATAAAANGQQPTDAAAAVAALAPRAFLPLSDGELAAITPETAQDFRFRLPLPAPAPGPPQHQQLANKPEGQDTAMAEAPQDDGKGATGGGGGADLATAPAAAGPDAAAAATGSADGTVAEGSGSGGGGSSAWGVAEAREALLKLECLPASARARATEEWVANHYRWVVWKLAAYERRFPAHCRGRSLAPEGVLDQLRRRVQAELADGARPVLAAIMAHDRPAAAPMVLAISGLPKLSGWTGAAEGMRVEVTDGWYWLPAVLDAALAQLVVRGRLQLGCKVRVSGAELQSPGPGEPLEACRTALLRLHHNGVSPAPWDAKLGLQVRPAPVALRPLDSVVAGGGVVPATIVLVQARYGILTFERTAEGGSVHRTPKAQEERLRRGAAAQGEAAAAALATVRRSEADYARRLQRSGRSTRAQRAYAAMVLGGGEGDEGGGLGAGGGDGGELGAEDRAALNRLMTERQTHMAAEQQRVLNDPGQGQGQGAGGRGGGGGGGGGDGDVGSPYLRLQVVGVTPHGVASGPPRAALIRVWRPPGDLEEVAREGAVLLVTQLQPSSSAGGGMADLGCGRLRCLELHTTKGTRWQPLGQAANLSHVLQLPYALPRRLLKLADIPSALPPPLLARFVLPSAAANPHAHGHQQHQQQAQAAALPGPNDPEALSCFFEFDFVGCVVRVGEVMGSAEGGGWRQQQAQWVFLADPTSGLCGAGGAAGPQPWLLAVKLVGAPESVDFIADPAREVGSVLHFRHLLLQNRDEANQLWVAVAADTASLARVAGPPPAGGGGGGGSSIGTGAGAYGGGVGGGVGGARGAGAEVVEWARGQAGREQLQMYGRKIDWLLGGGQ